MNAMKEPSTGAAASEFAVTVHADWSSVEPLAAEWDALGERVGADIYTSHAHAGVWWRHYGRGTLAVVEVRSRPAGSDRWELLGVVPCFVDRLPAAGWARVARLIAADSTMTVLAPAVSPDHATKVWSCVLSALLDRCEVVCLSALDGRRGCAAGIVEAARGVSADLETRVRSMGVHSTFLLPSSFEEFMQGLDKRQRTNLRRDLNLLSRDADSSVQALTSSSDVASAFEEFLSMHAEQWSCEGKAGHFGEWPGAEAFSRELNEVLSRRQRVQLVRVSRGAENIAFEWSFRFARRGFWRLPARRVGPEFERLGLGRLGMARMIEAMIAAGVREIEAGPGHYEYKLKHGAIESPLESVWICRRSAVGRARVALLAGSVRLIDLAYYRIWFRRVRSRLGRGRKPLWSVWTRLRI